jgi:hypothetical protein
MRKLMLGVLIVIFVSATSFLILGIVNKAQNRNLQYEMIKRLPAFSFMTLTNEMFNSSQISKGPVLVIRFHPDCEHCQYEISEIVRSNIPDTAILIIMVSSADSGRVKNYLDQFDISHHPGIIPLVDSNYSFGEIFGRDIVPSNYIYNKELNLVKVMYGEVKPETIIKYLEGSE